MSVTIIHKKGSGIPSAESLEVAEVCVDIVTGILYTKILTGEVVPIGSAEGGSNVSVSDDMPTDSESGDMWYCTKDDNEGMFVFDNGVWFESTTAALEGPQGPEGPAGGIEEAPEDSLIYGRSDAAWVEVTTGGDVEEAPEDNTLYGRKDGDWEAVPVSSGGLDPAVWTDQLANDLAIMASDYVSTNFPIHPLIEWTGGFLQLGAWRIGVGPLGFQMIYYDTPEGVVFTDSGVIRATGEVRGQSDDVIDVVSKSTRANKFTLGDFIISNVGERLCFYYQDTLKAVVDENGHLNMLGQAIANYGSAVKSVDVRSADYSFGDWFMSADGDKLSVGTDAGVMATVIGEGSLAGTGTVKEDEVLI